MEIARMDARALPMYATPLSTTAGNSIRLPSPRDHAIRNGGRRRMFACTCVRAASTPYIGHWSAGRYR